MTSPTEAVDEAIRQELQNAAALYQSYLEQATELALDSSIPTRGGRQRLADAQASLAYTALATELRRAVEDQAKRALDMLDGGATQTTISLALNDAIEGALFRDDVEDVGGNDVWLGCGPDATVEDIQRYLEETLAELVGEPEPEPILWATWPTTEESTGGLRNVLWVDVTLIGGEHDGWYFRAFEGGPTLTEIREKGSTVQSVYQPGNVQPFGPRYRFLAGHRAELVTD